MNLLSVLLKNDRISNKIKDIHLGYVYNNLNERV